MLITRSFNKEVPVVNDVIWEIHGSNPSGINVFIENQHASNTLVYSFEESVDGVTWTAISFSAVTTFSLIAGGTPHQVKITSGNPHVRMKGYGDLPVAIGVTTYSATSVDSDDVVTIY